MTRRGCWALAAWTAYLVAANLVWLRENLPERPPNWDRALYLYLSVRFLHAQQDGGLTELAREFVARSPTVAPLFPLTTAGGYLLAGESRLLAHATTSLYLVIFVAATFALGRSLHGPAAGLLAAFALSTFPGVTLAGRDYMMDLPAAALATAAVALLVEADFGRRRWLALGAGALGGLTLLTKTMAAVFLAAPAAEALWRARRDARCAANLGMALGLALLVAACWWGPNHADAAAYLWRYGFSADALPFAAGGLSPLGWRNLGYYPAALVNEGLGPAQAALLAVALLSAVRPDAFLLRWSFASLAILTVVPNKSGERYILGLLPSLAILLGIALARIPARPLRRAAVFALLLIGLYTHAGLTYELGLPRLYYHEDGGLVAVTPAARPRQANDGTPENPWPAARAVFAAHEEARGARAEPLPPPARGLTPVELVRAVYRRLLKREPDAEGLAAYARDLEAGALTPEGLVRAIAASPEFSGRPARVLVVPDHPFVNASVLRYYAERARLPLAFDHPTENLPEGDLADRYDVALSKHGGEQGPAHTSAVIPVLERRLAAEAARWHTAGRFRCPDGSEIELLAARIAW